MNVLFTHDKIDVSVSLSLDSGLSCILASVRKGDDASRVIKVTLGYIKYQRHML